MKLPSNPVLSYLKEQSIIWDMKIGDMKRRFSRVLQKLQHKFKPPAVVALQHPDPVRNPENQFAVTQDAANLYRYIIRGRSFAITESGRCAWVPDTTVEGDQVAVILAYDLPMVLRRVDSDQEYERRADDVGNKDDVRGEGSDHYEFYDPVNMVIRAKNFEPQTQEAKANRAKFRKLLHGRMWK